MSRTSLLIDEDKLEVLQKRFATLRDEDYLEKKDLGEALNLMGFSLPGYELRDLEQELGLGDMTQIPSEYLMMVYGHVKEKKDVGRSVYAKGKVLKRDESIKQHASAEESTSTYIHTVSHAEEIGFCNWINRVLAKDEDCARYLPVDPNQPADLYEKCKDGVLLCKLINSAVKETIDNRTINKGERNLSLVFKRNENLTLAVNSAESIGCCVVNIGPEDIAEARKHLVLGLIWQVIRIGLLGQINLTYHSELKALLRDGETLDDLKMLTPEQLLLRWVNYHLERAGCDRRINNFKEDIQDSEIYSHLINQITPNNMKGQLKPVNNILAASDKMQRANGVLDNAEVLDARVFLQAEDIARSTEAGKNRDHLNLAFVANLFNNYPALEADEEEEEEQETLEELTYRNWMNSLGVAPFVKDLYSDLRNGLVLLQLCDILKPGVVDWKKVERKFDDKRGMFKMQSNCNFVMQYLAACDIKLVNIDAENIRKGDRKLTLALCFQMMLNYTLKLLMKLRGDGQKIDDKALVKWANQMVSDSGKSSSEISGFRDAKIATGMPVLDLVEAITPESVNFDHVEKDNKLGNCRLAISMARKIGARVYALPQHLVDLNSRMIMTVYACLMFLYYQKQQVQE